ncbi:MAG: hypothetical protein AABW99_03795 [archaeon]
MRFKYFFGAIASNVYRLLRVFPNSDPLMGFIVPASKSEAWWKAPLFAFATMFTFDLITRFGTWTWVTASTYALIALALHSVLKNRKSTLKLFMGAGALGILAFDFITGPLMISFIDGKSFWTTLVLQVPFTAMHLVSGVFYIIIISPFLDKEIMKEVSALIHSAKGIVKAMVAA